MRRSSTNSKRPSAGRLERDQSRLGSDWDKLFARDKTGILLKRMEEAVDGEYQSYKAKGGEYIRREFFGKYPELLQLCLT